MKRLLFLAVPALSLALSAPLHAAGEAGKPSDEEVRHAREELSRAREELRRAAEELARVTIETDRDNPRGRAYEYMTNPRRAMLGVMIDDGPEQGDEVRGVLLTGVTPDSGADKAGLKSGDILIAANGKKLATRSGEHGGPQRRLRDIMGDLRPGDEVKLDYERDGKRFNTTVIASRMEMGDLPPMLGWSDDDNDVVVPPLPPFPPRPPAPPMPPLPPQHAMMMRHGTPDMELARLDSELAPYFHTDKGVLVVAAPRSGSLGLKSGDVIQQIGGKPVDSPVDVWERFGDADGAAKIKVDIVRQGRNMNLEGTLPERGRLQRRIELRTDDADERAHDRDHDDH